MMVLWDELPRSPGHLFFDRLQGVLREAGFDAFAGNLCQVFCTTRMGAPSLQPGRCFQMHLVGYFEEIASERGLECRCADSLSLRDFLGLAGAAPDAEVPADLVADKGYHSLETLKDLHGGPWRSRIAEPKPEGVHRWQGDVEVHRAVYGNRARLRSGVAREALKLPAELVERSFEHSLDRGGLRRTHLRGRANVQKRHLIHVAGFNPGLVMRLLLGTGTPMELTARGGFVSWLIDPAAGFVLLVILQPHNPFQPANDRSGPMDRDTDIAVSEPQTLPSSTV